MTTATAHAAPPAADRARAARLFHALSDETRLAILDMLQDGEHCVCDLQDALDAAQSRLSFHLKVLRDGERCVCDLQVDLDAAQSRLSFHLRVLKDAGLVTDRKEGRWSYYALVPETLAEVHALVVGLDPSARRVRGGKGRGGQPAPLRVVGNCCG